uniref:UDP-N-acetylmuramoylalanine--D-glutamate ligase n=1 Tax=Magnetococcus massalia (strain MO-1) TaxID=451514 RepID=A0A1S7LLM8_MAGMO|nr:UDP-N-acetylmuramoylalanine--D-glutamate ligase [Candidatus Magnetococcus massalia]
MTCGQSWAVIGLGGSGMAAVRFLQRQGHRVIAWDEGKPGQQLPELEQLTGVTPRFAPLALAPLQGCDGIILSPGVPRAHPILQQLAEAGQSIINDVEWLFRHAPQADFIGITGTNGKSTVTTLVGEMVGQMAEMSRVGGNLGEAALSLYGEKVARYVLELSSFQLESIDSFRPRVAALLNLSDDHLDRYDGLSGYLAAKERIFLNQTADDVAVINRDDPALAASCNRLNGPKLVGFSVERAIPGGVYLHGGQLWDHRDTQTAPISIISQDEIRLQGRCNQSNAAAAAAIALSSGATHAMVAQTLRSFGGLPHRLEWLRELDKIDYVNDSKGTNVGAVLESLRSFPNKVILIAGGVAKGADFTPLQPLIAQHARAVVLIGRSRPQMGECFAGLAPLHEAEDLTHALTTARQLAQSGDTVLLSPACASFDMFRNFEHRGEQFRQLVLALS